MLDTPRVLELLGGLTLLNFFPSDVGSRLELAKLVGRMANGWSIGPWACAMSGRVRWYSGRFSAPGFGHRTGSKPEVRRHSRMVRHRREGLRLHPMPSCRPGVK
jgi:hypothetical protein